MGIFYAVLQLVAKQDAAVQVTEPPLHSNEIQAHAQLTNLNLERFDKFPGPLFPMKKASIKER